MHSQPGQQTLLKVRLNALRLGNWIRSDIELLVGLAILVVPVTRLGRSTRNSYFLIVAMGLQTQAT